VLVLRTSKIKNERKKKQFEQVVAHNAAHAAPKLLPSTAQLLLRSQSARLHPSKQAVLRCSTSSKLGKCSQQLQILRVVLIMHANITNTACCAFLSGTDPSMPSKALIQPNEQNIDQLLKVSEGNSKIHTGKGLKTKAKRDRAELQSSNVTYAFAYQRVCSLVSNSRFL
jgi:hypothetical protein